MQRSLVWKKLGDLLNGVIMTAVWMTGVWRRRVDNQAYIRNYPRLGTPVAVEMPVEGAEGVDLAAETACLHVGEDMTRARPDTPTPRSDPRGSVHRGVASSRPAPSDAANSCLDICTEHDQDICILSSLVIKYQGRWPSLGGHAMQRSLVWKKLGDLLNGVRLSG